VLRCGSCGGQLVATPQRTAAGVLVPRYGCRKEKGGCGKVSILAEPVERIVSEAVVQRLSDSAFVARLNGGAGGASEDDAAQRAELAGLEASLEEASRDFYVDKLISRPEFIAARDALVPKIDSARAALARTTRRRPSSLLAGIDDLGKRWDGLGADRQRALIELCVESVTIASAKGLGGQFDSSRVRRPVWRV
jgi:hypothetical protein